MTPMLRPASLGMYDFPWLAEANDALWAGFARHLRAQGLDGVPDGLDRARPVGAILRDPRLLLAQTCGYPLMTELAGIVRPVATPVYALPGCVGPTHASFIIVRRDSAWVRLEELRGAVAAINGWDSNSGMNLLRHAVAPLARGGRFFARVVVTGAHLASMAAVSGGEADLAAIDCVTYGLTARERPGLVAGVRVLAQTAGTPALPFVTRSASPAAELAALRAGLLAAAADPALAAACRRLALAGFTVLETPAYRRVLELEREAAALGYPTLG